MDVIDVLMGQLDDNMVSQLKNHIGAESNEQTEAAATGVINTLVTALSRNAASEEGANSLVSALDRDHDGSVLDDVAGFLMGSRQPQNTNMLNGAGILKHVLGGNQQNQVQDMLGRVTGLDKSQIGKLMITLAPMVLGALGKVRKQENANTSMIQQILMGTVQTQQVRKPDMNLLERFLDQDGDGSIMDDIANIGIKAFLNRKS